MPRPTAPVRYDTLELAPTGRSRCTVCGGTIAAGQVRLRIGWTSGFVYVHPACAATSEPWAHWVGSALGATALEVPDRESLAATAAATVGAVQARTRRALAAEEAAEAGFPAADRVGAGQAGTCLHCRTPVEEGALGVVERRGPLHLACALPWAERHAGRPAERWVRALFENTAGLDDADQAAVERAMGGTAGA